MDGTRSAADRTIRRMEAIRAVMRSIEWRYFQCSRWLRPYPLFLEECCLPPDPADIQIRKRDWEERVQAWRRALRFLELYEL